MEKKLLALDSNTHRAFLNREIVSSGPGRQCHGGLFLKDANKKCVRGYLTPPWFFLYAQKGRKVDLSGNLCLVWLGSAEV